MLRGGTGVFQSDPSKSCHSVSQDNDFSEIRDIDGVNGEIGENKRRMWPHDIVHAPCGSDLSNWKTRKWRITIRYREQKSRIPYHNESRCFNGDRITNPCAGHSALTVSKYNRTGNISIRYRRGTNEKWGLSISRVILINGSLANRTEKSQYDLNNPEHSRLLIPARYISFPEISIKFKTRQ